MSNLNYDFSGKVVAITGAAGAGMGGYFARDFFAAGANVAICSRNEARIMEARDEIGATDPSRIFAMVADMSDVGQCRAFIEGTVAHFGRVDIFVNNAGIFFSEPSVDVIQEHWDKTIDTKLRGYFFSAQAAATDMMKRGEPGVIINIGSVTAESKTLDHATYAVANAGVAHMTKCLAREWGPHGIRVNCIQPGSVPTEINVALYEGNLEREMAICRKIPLGRRGTSKEISNSVLFLASDESSYITGNVLNVDGGFLLYSI